MNIELVNLRRQYQRYSKEINVAVQKVLASGRYILGEEVESFEKEFARYCGAQYCIGVASGTDALFLSLQALGIQHGDEVITSPFSFVASAFSISMTGAVPVFADIDQRTYTIDTQGIEKKITKKTKAILPVHLYGQPADMDVINVIARKYHLAIIQDACQAHGALYRGQRIGSLGNAAAFSFNPPKNLGCYGDGGAVVTNSATLANKVRLLREYGSSRKYYHLTKGTNSRLDELQAAVLRIKLRHLDDWNKRRREIARQYTTGLRGLPLVLPSVAADITPVWHQYVVRVRRRGIFINYLKARGVPTNIHYPIPIHLQPAYRELCYNRGSFSAAEQVCREVVSLPLCPELTEREVGYIINCIKKYYNAL
jgi:dTDP-4-amino-4,6-dideoxygalactose transaminase